MDLFDFSEKRGIFSSAFAFFSVSPVIITAWAYLKRPAEGSDPMIISESLKKRVLYLRSLAKYAAAFFKMSRSS